MVSNYGNITSIIKNHIIDTNMHFVREIEGEMVDTVVSWKILQIEEPYNLMFSGDLVANISLHFENKIYDFTKEVLKDIEEKLKNENKLTNGEFIVFSIVKNIT
jgi:hypothetical protein